MRRLIALLAAAAAVALSGCAAGQASGPETSASGSAAIRVVASPGVYADLVTELGGDAVSVHRLGPADPTGWAPGEDDLAAVAAADLAVVNGAGVDEAAADLVDGAFAGQLLLVVSGVDPTDPETATQSPYSWWDVERVLSFAEAFTSQAMLLAPASATELDVRGAAVSAELEELAARIAGLREELAGAVVGSDSPWADPLLDSLGLVVGEGPQLGLAEWPESGVRYAAWMGANLDAIIATVDQVETDNDFH